MSVSLLLAQPPPSSLKCPRCQQAGARKVKGQRAVCRRCSVALRRVYQFCWACRREWLGGMEENSCTLPGCALQAALLSTDVIVDPGSSVKGCPFFRACPGCMTLLTHSGVGCPNIICPQCHKEFCFRCLKEECYEQDEVDDDDFEYEDDFHQVPCTVVDNSQSLRVLGL